MKFSTTLGLIKSDYVRMSEFWDKKLGFLSSIKFTFSPSLFSIILYRFSHYFYTKGLKFLSWPLWALNTTITGADLIPSTIIGRSFFIGHPLGTVIAGRLGNNVTLYGQAAIGGGRGEKDIGGGPGLPYIKDNVTVGFRASILGSIVIDNGSVIGACSFVTKNVAEGATVIGNPARPLRTSVNTTRKRKLHSEPRLAEAETKP